MGENRDKRAAYNTLDAIKAAGLGPVKRKAKTGLYVILGLLLLATVGAGVYFGLSYWADQEVPQAGPQKASGYKQLEDQNLSADEAARIKGMFEVDAAPAQPGAAPRRRTVIEEKLLSFYQGQKVAKHDYVPAEPKYTDGMLIQTGTVTEPNAPGKAESVPTGPDRIGGPQRLSSAQVEAAVSKHRKRVKRRLERSLNRYPELAGKLVLVIRVHPDGSVEKARVETPKYHGTGIEEFLVKDAARWKFPAFDGVPYDLTFPFILSGK
jgi:hypothetical protein